MDVIHLLPDSVANQIAAGEVIQRPASCLKELVENSLDAGARHIQVVVIDAGRTLLQVIDDGVGMSATDVRMAFERHATSKITEAKDLFDLHTMGFRGEALASICAVAHVEVMTRRAEDEVGTLLEIAGSTVVRQESCQCPVGTNFKVKDLFYNVPARRKFLKTDQTELRNLLQDFYRIVLVYPHVQFTFVQGDEVLVDLPQQTYKQRIEGIFGKSTAKPFTGQLVDLQVDTEMVTIHGFVGKPETASRTAHQYFFVNGRYMRHPYFHKAIMAAYAGMLPGDYIPSYFIYFDINPQAIDVNIHPTKTEIKFQDEQYIFQILVATVREALGKFNIAPSIDFDRVGEVEMPSSKATKSVPMPKVVANPGYNPFKRTASPFATPVGAVASNPEIEPIAEPKEEVVQLFDLDIASLPLYQYADRYILVPGSEGLFFINQHRAHYAILYQKLMLQMVDGKGLKQQVLFPEELHLSADEDVLFRSIMKELEYVGFEFDQYARNAYSVTAVPVQFGEKSALPILKDILAEVKTVGTPVREQWQKRIATILAEEMAIPYGRHLSELECRDIVQQLFKIPNYRIAPDGKTILFLLTNEEIKKRF